MFCWILRKDDKNAACREERLLCYLVSYYLIIFNGWCVLRLILQNLEITETLLSKVIRVRDKLACQEIPRLFQGLFNFGNNSW